MAYAATGILQLSGLGTTFELERFPPAPELAFWVLRYWCVRWELAEQAAYTQETLPYPCVNVAVEPERAGVFGVHTRRFEQELVGTGWVWGIKFRPGAFGAFLDAPVATLTDRVCALADVFGTAGPAYVDAIRACADTPARMACTDAWLRTQVPPPDPQVPFIDRVVAQIAADRTLITVAALAQRVGVSQRSLQRLFHRAVGVSPKWVIQRYRLLEAAEQLASGAAVDLAELAVMLGYYDQSHLHNDFRAATGTTPADYARTAVAARAAES